MRSLILILLLANAAYFGWQFQAARTAGPATKPPVELLQPPGERLVLLSERPRESITQPTEAPEPAGKVSSTPASTQAERPPPAPPLHATEMEPAAASCFRIAGIAQAQQADVVAATLEQAGATVVGRGDSQHPVTNYWTMLPPGSTDAAKRAVARLERARIKDFYIVRSGEYAGAISLGVFSTREAAERRVAAVAALRPSPGKPRIQPLELTAKRTWLMVRWGSVPSPGWRNAAKDQDVVVTSAACP